LQQLGYGATIPPARSAKGSLRLEAFENTEVTGRFLVCIHVHVLGKKIRGCTLQFKNCHHRAQLLSRGNCCGAVDIAKWAMQLLFELV